MEKPNLCFEKQFRDLGFNLIAGVDEVGRGCLAGPIVACAVIFADYENLAAKLRGADDSKKLKEKERLKYDKKIKKLALDLAIGEVSAVEIDQIGIGAANILAFKRALDQLKKVDFALIDGRRFRGLDRKYFCLEKGESKSLSIATASIVAKVYRDRLMTDLGEKHAYDFANNKGYGSKSHLKAIADHGPSKYHRQSFLKKFFAPDQQRQLF